MGVTAVLGEIIGPDILIILAIVALLFGSNQLPKLARSLGSAKSEFERGLHLGGNDPGKPEPSPETVTLTHAELDALIAEREARGRQGPTAT
jgi:sec-independent protein translocase protein TatA